MALKAPEPPEMHNLQQQTPQQQTPQQQNSSPPQGQAQNQQQQQQQQVGQQVSAGAQASAPAPAPKPDQRPAPASKLVSVPDLSGMSFEEAKVALSGLGLLIKVTGQQHSEVMPEGRVLFQDAPPGFEAQPGATVAVTLSSGPPPTTPQGATEEQINRIQTRVSASTGTSTTAADSGPADNTRAWVARNNRAINSPGSGAASSRR